MKLCVNTNKNLLMNTRFQTMYCKGIQGTYGLQYLWSFPSVVVIIQVRLRTQRVNSF